MNRIKKLFFVTLIFFIFWGTTLSYGMGRRFYSDSEDMRWIIPYYAEELTYNLFDWELKHGELCTGKFLGNKILRFNLSRCSFLFRLPDFKICKNLKDLNLSYCVNLRDILALTEIQSLRWVNFQECRSLWNIRPIGSLENLEILNLDGCESIRDFSILIRLTNLKSLGLCSTGIESLDYLKELIKLNRLALCHCFALKDFTALSGLVGLKVLFLNDCQYLELLPDLSNLTQLQFLSLADCESLTDISGVSGLISLESLNLSGCSCLCDISPIRGITGLKILNLSWCNRIKNMSVVSDLTGLEELNFSGCLGLSSSNFPALSRCKSLKKLDIRYTYFAEGISNVLLKNAAENFSHDDVVRLLMAIDERDSGVLETKHKRARVLDKNLSVLCD